MTDLKKTKKTKKKEVPFKEGVSFKIEIDTQRLCDIARYYQFPLAIFFGGNIPEGTRNDNRLKRINVWYEAIKRIKEIVEEL